VTDIHDIQAESFDDEVKNTVGAVVLEFWLRSCSGCQKFKPVYDMLPELMGDKIKFLRMNMLKSIENLRLAEGLGVEVTPTTKIFCNGDEVGEIVGYRSLEEAAEEIEGALSGTACA
jgi:thioredoxin 1